MSEAIPESIPTSADPRSRRPVKKAKTNTSTSAQHAAVEALFAKQPDVQIPVSATKGPRSASSLPAPPELVANVQGSSAGAGSGEFHVYKASRRREYERLRLLDEESKRNEATQEWETKQAELKKRDEQKLSKNQKRRQKAKQRKDNDGKQDKDKGSAKESKKEHSGAGPRSPESDQDAGDNATEEGNGITIVDE